MVYRSNNTLMYLLPIDTSVTKMSSSNPKQSQIEPETVENQTFELQDKNNFGIHLKKLTRKYFEETSIHGLKYILERKRNVIERIFWTLATLSLWTFGIYLIYGVSIN